MPGRGPGGLNTIQPPLRRSGGAVVSVGFLALILCRAAPAAGQSVTFFSMDPPVIPAGRTAPVLFEAGISGGPTRVFFELGPGVAGPFVTGLPQLAMQDDGTSGDRRSGDGVYSVLLPASAIVGALRSDDVQRVTVGFLNVMNGSTSVSRLNVFASVYTNNVGTTLITQLASNIQTTSRVVNIYDPSFFVDFSVPRIAQQFYRLFPDDFDFLNVIYMPGRSLNRSHGVVRNDVDGIGLARFDGTRSYGSAGRLKGFTSFPTDTFFDGATTGYNHEIGHQWINYLNFFPLNLGLPHWPLGNLAGGVMGWSLPGLGNEGVNFPCTVVQQGGIVTLGPRPDEPVFTDFDLYLMGLVPAEQVGEAIVFADQAAAQQLRCNGQAFPGAVYRVGVQEVIAQLGPRRPSAVDSQKQFRMATIIVSRDGLVSPETMWLYTWLAARAELRSPVAIHEGFLKTTGKPFFVATGGRASLDTMIFGPTGVPGTPMNLTAAAAGSVATLTWIAPTSGATPTAYTIEAGSVTGSSDLASFSTGSVVTSFSPGGVAAGTYYVRVRATNAAGASAPSNEVTLSVGSGPCSSPPSAPAGLSASVSGSTVQLLWSAAATVTAYIIEAGSFSGARNLAVLDTGNATSSFTAASVGAGTYFVRVRARNLCGTSGASNETVVVVR
jgi:hypothetical protein